MTNEEITQLINDIAEATDGKGIVECVTVRQVARSDGGLEHETEVRIELKQQG